MNLLIESVDVPITCTVDSDSGFQIVNDLSRKPRNILFSIYNYKMFPGLVLKLNFDKADGN
jgi:hypothetical protein